MLSMHGEVEEVWSGCSTCWFDRSLVPGDVNPHGIGLPHCVDFPYSLVLRSIGLGYY